MPREKNRLVRVIVPAVAALAGVGVVIAVYVTSAGGGPPAGAPGVAATEPAPIEGDGAPEAPAVDSIAATNGAEEAGAGAPSSGAEPASERRQEQAQAPAEPAAPSASPAPEGVGSARLRARAFADAPADFAPIGGVAPDGSVDAASDYVLHVDFAPDYGAGVESIALTKHYETVKKERHYRVQERRVYAPPSGPPVTVASMAAVGVEVTRPGRAPEFVDLRLGPIWRELAPGEFEAFLADGEGEAVVRIWKRYRIEPGSYSIGVEQRLFNLTNEALRVRWYQYGPVDLPIGEVGYGGDMRRVRFGFLLSPSDDASRQIVETDRKLRSRRDIVERAMKAARPETLLWPDEDTAKRERELVWGAMTNRHFGFAVHSAVAPDAALARAPIDKRLNEAELVHGVVLGHGDQQTLVFQLTGPEREVAAQGELDLSVAAYTGPLSNRAMATDPAHGALRLDKLIVYNFGGPCAFCTFQWLTHGLYFFLSFFERYLVHDWAVAIMILVVCVRAVLHPVTRRSQIAMQRFGKQMQALAPKQQKLRERYKDDPKRMQQEMAKLFREEGVNFTGMFGCLPMFLQSPIWIALYAMLYFTFELRHDPAFYGVFQALTGGQWAFLGDLSAPDRFIYFGRALVTLPLLGRIDSFNLLPILLGVVFFLQQKYLTPPPSAAMTPEQAQQQKIMKVMMVVMFPLIMYPAPSGLAIYFITNSVLGILESRHIRAHIEKEDLDPSLKKPKKQGRLAMALAEARARAMERAGMAGAPGQGPGKRQVPNTAQGPFQKKRGREGSPYKARGKKKKP